jgi:trk system potassium uptake protein TrkA
MEDFAAALGLSTFCKQVAVSLEELGKKVIAVDVSEQRVNQIRDSVTKAIAADLRDRDILDEIGVLDCTTAIIGLPDHFDIGVLLVHYLKTHGVPEIIVQVNTDDQEAAIKVVGATRTVFPERDSAAQLVRAITLPGLLDRIDITQDAAIVELNCPAEYVGRSLKGLDLRKKYNVHVVGLIRHQGGQPQTIVAPPAEEPLQEEDVLMVLGTTSRIRNFSNQMDRLRKDKK